MTKATTTNASKANAASPKPRPRPRTLRPWRVILHNDNFNSARFVLDIVVKLTPLPKIEAIHKIYDAREAGQSPLLVTRREQAELYVQQFSCYSITVTAEPGLW